MRKAEVRFKNVHAGILIENESGYHFTYDAGYSASPTAASISFTFPITTGEFHSKVLFPFFDGLIPEGWLLEIVEHNWKFNPRDRMGLLIACCEQCIGAVSIHAMESET